MTTCAAGYRYSNSRGPGVGVEALEKDPPLYHFDVEGDDWAALIADPEQFLARLGLGPDQGIAPAGAVQLSIGARTWTGEGWQGSTYTNSLQPRGCCYVSDDAVYCHRH